MSEILSVPEKRRLAHFTCELVSSRIRAAIGPHALRYNLPSGALVEADEFADWYSRTDEPAVLMPVRVDTNNVECVVNSPTPEAKARFLDARRGVDEGLRDLVVQSGSSDVTFSVEGSKQSLTLSEISRWIRGFDPGDMGTVTGYWEKSPHGRQTYVLRANAVRLDRDLQRPRLGVFGRLLRRLFGSRHFSGRVAGS